MAQISALLLRPELWILVILLAGILVLLARRLNLAWRPAWLLRAALVSLVVLGIFSARQELERDDQPRAQVLVVDQSDSLSLVTRTAARQQALAWRSQGQNRQVVGFGAGAVPLVGDGPSTHVDGRSSDLAGALELAGRLLGGTPGDILLQTDGLAEDPGQAAAAASALAAGGHTLNILPLSPRSAEGDVALGSLSAPASLWAGTDFDLLVPVFGGQVPLRLEVNGQETPADPEPAGAGWARFRVAGLPEGVAVLKVSAEIPDDPFPENNTVYKTVRVHPSPRVLFLTRRGGQEPAAGFVQRLVQNGIQVDTAQPDALPTNLDALQVYRVIFLDNLLASHLSQEQMSALQIFVSRMAGGLVFLGGQNSYTLGGYQNTLLEPMLPVKMEAPPRSERPPVVFQLVLDRSSSMGTGGDPDTPTPMVLAREAAMRAIETLRAEDTLGVLTFSDKLSWDVPLAPLGGTAGLRLAMDAVSQVRPNGGTYMYQAMQDALAGLGALPPDAPSGRHMLVLSDGQSADGQDEEFRALAEAAHLQGITISTISLGSAADSRLMASIAEAGSGRFYAVQDARDLPRILIAESQAARSENVQAGETSLQVSETGHPILSGLSQSQLPNLSGYNALSSRTEEGAEDVLVSSTFRDPILSDWQYGLGRVVAWMGDLGEAWTAGWPVEAQGRFWSQVVRFALVDPGLGPSQVVIQVEPARLDVEAAVSTTGGDPVNLAEVVFTYLDASGTAHSLRLPQTGAGIYHLSVPRPPEGAYRAVVRYQDENGQTVEIPAPFSVDPPEEWLPPDAGAGLANLTAWAQAGGGQLLNPEQVFTGQMLGEEEPSGRQGDWSWWLLLGLVLLWPMEIAIRRRWLPWM